MKIRKLIGSLIALGAFGIVLGPGCADNRSSIFIVGALAVPQDTCEITESDTSARVPAGRLDLALSREYWASLLVGNQLVARGNATTLRTETSRVSFYEAEVRLTDSGGADLATGTFVVPVSGFADAASGTEPGFGSASVTLIDATAAQSMAPGQYIANVIVRGETLGNIDVETDEFAFPITVCNGCLVLLSADGDDPARPGVDCDVRDEAPVYCRMGMDEAVDCRACSGISPLCKP
ncbi:MAG TPA: hypothetical protein PK156_25120 [Polyangium sp.]|nr:hypothetical protein [Polyangium sp.]